MFQDIENFTSQVDEKNLIPTIDYPINPKALSEWVNMHQPVTLESAQKFFGDQVEEEDLITFVNENKDKDPVRAAQFVASAIQYVDFPTWLNALTITLTKFLKQMMIQQTPYAVLKPYGGNCKSGYWVLQWALRIIKKLGGPMPVGIANYYIEGINNYLLVDDGIYSGRQILTQTIPQWFTTFSSVSKDVAIHIVAPYVSSLAVSKFKPNIYQLISKSLFIQLYYTHLMPTLKEVFVDKLEILHLIKDSLDVDVDQPLIYFQHKIPDQVSVPSQILNDGRVTFAGSRDFPALGHHRFVRGCEKFSNDPSIECPTPFYRNRMPGCDKKSK